jgi:hypothetical protein
VTEPPPLPPLTQIERLAFDYGDIEHWMAQLNQAIRQTRRVLQILASPIFEPALSDPQNRVALSPADIPEPGREDDHMEHRV